MSTNENFIGKLQEYEVSLGRKNPTYWEVNRSGPDHVPKFVYCVHLEGGCIFKSLVPCSTIAAAKQSAAEAAWNNRERVSLKPLSASPKSSGDKEQLRKLIYIVLTTVGQERSNPNIVNSIYVPDDTVTEFLSTLVLLSISYSDLGYNNFSYSISYQKKNLKIKNKK